MEKTFTRQDIRECLEALKGLPDFDKYPLPKYIHKEFNIPMTGYMAKTVNDYLTAHYKTSVMGGGKVEVREPKDNILRPMPTGEPVPVETIVGSADEIEKQLEYKLAPSTESNKTEPQENQDGSSSPASDASGHTATSASH